MIGVVIGAVIEDHRVVPFHIPRVTRAHAREIIVRGRFRTIISRTCARVTRGRPGFRGYVCLSVPALAASASGETSNQRYQLVSLWILIRGFSKKTSVQKLWREKANMQMS